MSKQQIGVIGSWPLWDVTLHSISKAEDFPYRYITVRGKKQKILSQNTLTKIYSYIFHRGIRRIARESAQNSDHGAGRRRHRCDDQCSSCRIWTKATLLSTAAMPISRIRSAATANLTSEGHPLYRRRRVRRRRRRAERSGDHARRTESGLQTG